MGRCAGAKPFRAARRNARQLPCRPAGRGLSPRSRHRGRGVAAGGRAGGRGGLSQPWRLARENGDRHHCICNDEDGVSQFELTGFLPYQLARAAARVSRAFGARYRAEFGISIPEWRVLAHLAQAGAVSVREIQARTDLDKSQVSRAAQRLEQAGYVEKRVHREDRRLVDLRLTETGQALFQRIEPVAVRYQAELLATLGEDGAALSRALTRIAEA
ncbi:MarR family transcriptional regulator, partial [Thioclava sp. BHET1]